MGLQRRSNPRSARGRTGSTRESGPRGSTLPPVPVVPEQLVEPLRALMGSAVLFQGVFIQAAEGRSVPQIMCERDAHLELASDVIDAWSASLDIRHQEK